MSKATKEMRLVYRCLLHLHFCVWGINLWYSFPPGEKKTKEQEEIHLPSVVGNCVRSQSQRPDWVMFYLWDLTLYWGWGERVL